jgi:preprotein translocase subunit SecG
METIQTGLLILQVLVAIALIGIILIQHGKGADAGAAFGSGASATVFGAQGSGNFLTRTTSVLALIFLLNSLALAYIAGQRVHDNTSLMQGKQLSGSVIQDQKGAKPAAPGDKQDKTGDSGNGTDVPAAPQ